MQSGCIFSCRRWVSSFQPRLHLCGRHPFHERESWRGPRSLLVTSSHVEAPNFRLSVLEQEGNHDEPKDTKGRYINTLHCERTVDDENILQHMKHIKYRSLQRNLQQHKYVYLSIVIVAYQLLRRTAGCAPVRPCCVRPGGVEQLCGEHLLHNEGRVRKHCLQICLELA